MSNLYHRGRNRFEERSYSSGNLPITERSVTNNKSQSFPDLADSASLTAEKIGQSNKPSIPYFNYYDFNSLPSSSTSTAAPMLSSVAPTEYGEYRVTPPTLKTKAAIGFLDDFTPQKGQKLLKNSNMFDGTCSLWPDSSLERLPPEQGRMQMLKSVYFSRNNYDLDKENAHFKFAEALISTFELLKWKKCVNCSSKDSLYSTNWDSNLDNSSTVYKHSDEDIVAEENFDAVEARENECDIKTYSAEEIAMGLLNKFQDKQLPFACDFMWMVCEKDVPQNNLPMPSGNIIDPDEMHILDVGTLFRGTHEWAPPRPQVIFTYKPPSLDRRAQMKMQGNRCEGCGIKVNQAYINRYRYCHYTGKYNCSSCHKNQMAIIPARVIQRWDFTILPVSVFAYRILCDIWNTPLYRVNHLCPELYNNVKHLRSARQIRVNLKYVKDFIMICRHAESIHSVFQEVPDYFTSDVDMYGMADFLAVKNALYGTRICL
ncbi:run domain Beclin-1-interacting and cysteine-rich domain-containing protein [Anopheles cruzii]|uniref:run domain Beclin-1-interacting and cysteine-rich domain-containing protein n=1 Tax=Anopheles cruzii TaxID=68878 RepID=UPI0022EC9105|nr:run domain Beclin-1-interacting and cysteine-rich domain-containing protein [Anopheles cruzii]